MLTTHTSLAGFSSGEYTAERLKELQRNAISFNAAKLAPPAESEEGSGPGGGGGGSGGGGEPLIKLSGSFKPAGAPKDDRFTMGSSTALVSAECMGVSGGEGSVWTDGSGGEGYSRDWPHGQQRVVRGRWSGGCGASTAKQQQGLTH